MKNRAIEMLRDCAESCRISLTPVAVRLVTLCLLFLASACSSPPAHRWYKGNLHTHTYWSDGDEYPEVVLSWYRDHEYDFIALSDHNTLSDEDYWLTFDTTNIRYPVYQRYLDQFGDSWVESTTVADTVRVRLKRYAEYAALFNEDDRFLVIHSEEITDRFEQKPIHLNATNLVDFITPQGGSSVVDVMQRNVNAVLEQRERTGQPMIPHINHPNYGWALTAEELAQVQGERFIEIYNGHPSVHNEGDALRPSVERIWDLVNQARLAQSRPLLYGIGVDDSHDYQEMRVGRVNPGRGWIMVQAETLSAAGLIEAMEAGRFYTSTGVVLDDVSFDGETLSVSVEEEEGVAYQIQFMGNRMPVSPDQADEETVGIVLYETSGVDASYTLTDSDIYVRAKVISSRLKSNPYREGEVERAWTQPVQSIQ